MNDHPFIREIRSPVTGHQLRPLDAGCEVIQFRDPLTDSEFVKLARFMQAYTHVPLRIYGHYGGAKDLAFLRHFPFLTGFQADVFEIESWDGLNFLPDSLEFLALGSTRRQFSLRHIARFTRLKDLFLDGHGKDLAVLGDFTDLVYLTLRSISKPDFSLLRPLRKLRSFALKLGGSNQLATLSELPQLRYLELWLVRGLSDLSVLAELQELRYLFLQALKNVTTLPSFERLSELHRVHIENMKGLSDLTSIAAAPRLEELLLVDMRHLSVDDLRCFREHPTLKAATIGLGSQRRNKEAALLLGRADAPEFKPIREYVEA